MQRSILSKSLPTSRLILDPTRLTPSTQISPCDIFINHRGVETKRTIAALLYQQFQGLGYNPFLDNRSMRPGENLSEQIDSAVKKCRVGMTLFSPRYCESYFCLHELSLMMECKKKVVPIFWDIKPSELHIKDHGSFSIKELERFQWAIEEAKNMVGLTFDTSNGDWSEFLITTTNTVLRNLTEAEEDERLKHKITKYHA